MNVQYNGPEISAATGTSHPNDSVRGNGLDKPLPLRPLSAFRSSACTRGTGRILDIYIVHDIIASTFEPACIIRTMSPEDRLCEDVLVALRQIVRAIDLHSKKLVQRHGVTGPQMLVLKKLAEAAPLAVGELARRANLSQATVTDILDRMQRRGLVSRMRSEADKRRVIVTLTAEGTRLLDTSPPLLQDSFVAGFQELPRWEQTAMVATVQRIAAMMNAERLAAPPLLDNARIDARLDDAALDNAMLSEDSAPREA